MFIVGYKDKSNERLQILNDVFESLHIATLDEHQHLQSLNDGLGDVNESLEESLSGVSGAIGKLDDISSEIISILAANRTGAAAKKRRILERKLNTMKTDMEKLNMKLLEAKDEVKSREARCYELQTLVTMRENKIKV